MSTTLHFLGAARTVTGSRHVLNHRGKAVMLDCGMFQGLKDLRLKNWDPFPLPPGYIDHVVLSHAHIDHSGYLPRFVRNGFGGRIFATPSTVELCGIMLQDSAHIQEDDARYANKLGFSKHTPALPLYTMEDAKAALEYFTPVDHGKPHTINANVQFELMEAGHILGSSLVRFTLRREDDSHFKVVFTGDLGRYGEHIIPDPECVEDADFLILESTYGDRLHTQQDIRTSLSTIIQETAARGGMILFPVFAVGRAQEILYYLRDLQDAGRIPDLPVYVDSPLAANATKIFCRHPEDHNLGVMKDEDADSCRILCHHLKFTRNLQDSIALHRLSEPAIVLSASGMCDAGRILHHLKWRLPNPRNSVVFVGYQAEGTRGRRILEGESEIKIHGELVPVNAAIHNLDFFSAHADYEEIFRWLGNFRRPPRRTFLVHGEPSQMDSLAAKIRERLGWDVYCPRMMEKVELDPLLDAPAGTA